MSLERHNITVRGFRIGITARSFAAAAAVAKSWESLPDRELAQRAIDSHPDATMAAPAVCSAQWGPVSWAKAFGLWADESVK